MIARPVAINLSALFDWAIKLVPVVNDYTTFPGFTVLWAGVNIPDGWLALSAQVLLIKEQPDLYRAFGTTYNTGGETADEFRLPPIPSAAPSPYVWIIKK